MDIPSTGNPVGDTLLAVATALYLFWILIKPKFDGMGKDVKEVVRQTANRHQNAPYPNLRDNLDANQAEVLDKLGAVSATLGVVQENVSSLTITVGNLSQQVSTMQKDIGGLKEENRDDRKSTQERFLLLEQKDRG